MKIEIANETAADVAAIRAVTISAFLHGEHTSHTSRAAMIFAPRRRNTKPRGALRQALAILPDKTKPLPTIVSRHVYPC